MSKPLLKQAKARYARSSLCKSPGLAGLEEELVSLFKNLASNSSLGLVSWYSMVLGA